MLGTSKDEVLDLLFGKGILPRRTLGAAYDKAAEFVDVDCPGCSPNSAWGFVQGLTRLSQETAFADARVEMDTAAGR